MPRRPDGVSGRVATLAALVAVLVVAAPAFGQDSVPIPPVRPDLDAVPGDESAAGIAAGAVPTAEGGVIRVLDKIDGTVSDLELRSAETATVGSLTITMGECRYPSDNPAGHAYVLLSIRRMSDEEAIFEGWMIASAPALNALDHPRFDVWALRCLGVAPPSAP